MEYATYFNRLLPKTNPSTKDVEVFRDILLSIHGETYNLLNDHLLEHFRGLCHKYKLRTGCSKLMHATNIAAIHNAILASSTTFSDEYLKSVLEVIKHPLYHVTYWIDDVVLNWRRDMRYGSLQLSKILSENWPITLSIQLSMSDSREA